MPAPTVDDLIEARQSIKKINSPETVAVLDLILRAIVALHEDADGDDGDGDEDDE